MDSETKKGILRKGSRVAGSGLLRHIYNGLKRVETRTKRRNLYCGDAAYCPRRAVLFAHTEGEQEMNAAGRLYMDTGTTVHRIVQEALTRSLIMIESERRVELTVEDVKVVGKIDGILKDDGELKILEIKTCGALPGKPKIDHMHQALAYSLLSGIYKIVVLYMSRKVASWDGKLEAIEFEHDVTPSDLKLVATLLATSIVGHSRRRLPSIPSHINSERDCGFCPFTQLCWHDGDLSLLKPFSPGDAMEAAEVAKTLLYASERNHDSFPATDR